MHKNAADHMLTSSSSTPPQKKKTNKNNPNKPNNNKMWQHSAFIGSVKWDDLYQVNTLMINQPNWTSRWWVNSKWMGQPSDALMVNELNRTSKWCATGKSTELDGDALTANQLNWTGPTAPLLLALEMGGVMKDCWFLNSFSRITVLNNPWNIFK